MNRVCTICARAGSQRFRDKNIYLVNDVPLLAYSIAAAKRSELFDQVVITSDSQDYLDIGLQWGADASVLRPDTLSHGKISKVHGVAHAVRETEVKLGRKFDTIVDLDVTGPLRRLVDIQNAVTLLETNECTTVVSATESKSTPFSNMFFKDAAGYIEPIISPELIDEHTGSTRTCYALNASIYAWERNNFMNEPTTFSDKTQLYIMPPFSRYDVDTAEDIVYLEYMMEFGPSDIIRI